MVISKSFIYSDQKVWSGYQNAEKKLHRIRIFDQYIQPDCSFKSEKKKKKSKNVL